jgi:hypothetical protein
MRSKSPEEKVRAYRAFFQGLLIAALAFDTLGLLLSSHTSPAIVFVLTAAVLLTTAFASSESQFAKEVEVIDRFCRERKCGYDAYPVNRSMCDDLRGDEGILLELTKCATMVIDERNMIDRCWNDKDLQGEKAAKVREQNAREAFRERWQYYRSVGGFGILPFKNPVKQTEWKDEEDFLTAVLWGMASLRYNAIGQRYA